MPALPFNYTDFSGGFNSYNAYDDLADNEARDLLNVQGTTAGAITKRTGLLSIQLTGAGMQGVWTSPGINDTPIVTDTAGHIYAVSGGLTTLKSGLSAAAKWEWIFAPSVGGQGSVYGINGTDTPQQWNGSLLSVMANWTATDAGGVVPNGQYIVYHKNQVFIAGTSAFPSRVYWSGLGDPTAWNPANNNGSGFEDFDPGDGEAITAIRAMGPYLLVAKPTKMWVLIDTATVSSRPISQSVGCVSHRSMVLGANGMYFLSKDRGVYTTNGSTVTSISDKIQPTFDGSNRSSAAAVYFNAHYYLSIKTSGGGGNTLVLDYYERLGSWWKHSLGAGGGVDQWTITSGAIPQVLCVSRGGQYLSQAFAPAIWQDNGTNYPWQWSGPWQSPSFYRRRRFPTPYFRKRFKQIRYDGLGQVDFSLCRDFNNTPTLIASDIFGNATTTKETRSYGQGVANVWSVVFSGTYPTTAQLNQYTLFMGDRQDSM